MTRKQTLKLPGSKTYEHKTWFVLSQTDAKTTWLDTRRWKKCEICSKEQTDTATTQLKTRKCEKWAHADLHQKWATDKLRNWTLNLIPFQNPQREGNHWWMWWKTINLRIPVQRCARDSQRMRGMQDSHCPVTATELRKLQRPQATVFLERVNW